MSEQTPLQPTAEPVRLDYAPPVGRSRATKLFLGLAASFFYAIGSGLVAFGIMLMFRNDRDAPSFVASGVTMIVFATGVIVSAWLARR